MLKIQDGRPESAEAEREAVWHTYCGGVGNEKCHVKEEKGK